MPASVYCCITTRDGRPASDCLRAVEASCARVPAGVRTRIDSTTCRLSVAVSRNMGVAKALAGPYTHLWFVDNDTLVQPDSLTLLLSCGAGVATGCTPTIAPGQQSPHLNIASHVLPGGQPVWLPRWFDGVIDTPICGAACLLIKMDVFRSLGFPWFCLDETWNPETGQYIWTSEDIDFCRSVTAAGLGPIRAHGDVRCGHRREVNVADLIPLEPIP